MIKNKKTRNMVVTLDIKHHQLRPNFAASFFDFFSFLYIFSSPSLPLDFCVTGRWLLVTQTRREFFFSRLFFYTFLFDSFWVSFCPCPFTRWCCYVCVFASALGPFSIKPPPTLKLGNRHSCYKKRRKRKRGKIYNTKNARNIEMILF